MQCELKVKDLFNNFKGIGIIDAVTLRKILYSFFEMNKEYSVNDVLFSNFNDAAFIIKNNIYIDYDKLIFNGYKLFEVLYGNIDDSYRKMYDKIHIINFFIIMMVFHEVKHVMQLQNDNDIKMLKVFQNELDLDFFNQNFQFNYYNYLYYEHDAVNFGLNVSLEFARNNNIFSDKEVFLLRYIAFNNIYSCYKNNSDIFEKLLRKIPNDYLKKYIDIKNIIAKFNLSFYEKINYGFPIMPDERNRLNKTYLLIKRNRIDRSISNNNILK